MSQWRPTVVCSQLTVTKRWNESGLSLQCLLVAHHGLSNPVLLLVQERRVEERHHQLQQGVPALLLLVVPGVNQQQARAKVLRVVRKCLEPLTLVAVVAKEEEVGHVIVTKAKEVVEAGSATMA